MEIPQWLEELVNQAARACESHAMSSVSWEAREEPGSWLVFFHETVTEMHEAGPNDGAEVLAGITVDLMEVWKLLEDEKHLPRGMSFETNALEREEHGFSGPFVSITGNYRGHFVELRFYAYPPKHAEPGIGMDDKGFWDKERADDE